VNDFVCHAAKADFTPQPHDENCKSKDDSDLGEGFGLAGGGYGAYTYCQECGAILAKTIDHGE